MQSVEQSKAKLKHRMHMRRARVTFLGAKHAIAYMLPFATPGGLDNNPGWCGWLNQPFYPLGRFVFVASGGVRLNHCTSKNLDGCAGRRDILT